MKTYWVETPAVVRRFAHKYWKLSYRRIALETGIPYATVCRIMQGKRVGVKTLTRITNAVGEDTQPHLPGL